MLIFRLEGLAMEAPMTDKVKAGFYRAATYDQIELFTDGDYSQGKRLHPLPEDDSMLHEAWMDLDCSEVQEWYFGFTSYEQLKRWFYDDWALNMCCPNIRLRVYDCEQVHVGYTQAIFNINAEVRLIAEFYPDVSGIEVHHTISEVYYV